MKWIQGLTRLKKYSYWWAARLYIRSELPTKEVLGAIAPWNENRHINFYGGFWQLRRRKNTQVNRLEAITVGYYGNFGNQVLETALAIYVAEKIGLGTVVTSCPGVFTPGNYSIAGVRLQVGRQAFKVTSWIEIALGIFGAFAPQKAHLHGAFLLNFLARPFDIEQQDLRRVFSQMSVALNLSDPGGPLPANELTVSFRGGDAFSVRPNSDYGQPPLSYYKFVVESAPWAHIRIVSDDDRNPSLTEFRRWLTGRGSSWELLEQDWFEDVKTLYRSSAILAPEGSFVPAIASISPYVKQCFLFGRIRFPCDIEKVRLVEDCNGEYISSILNHNWSASRSQIELMLNYGMKNLKFDEKFS